MSDEKKISLEDLEDLLEEDSSKSARINIHDLWMLVVLNLKWFVLSILLCLIIAAAYLYWAKPSVTVIGKMQIIDKSKQNSGMSAGMAMLNSLPLNIGSALGGGLGVAASGVDAEIEILQSNALVRSVVNDLGLNTEYRLKSWGRKKLLYQNQPVNVVLDATHLQWFNEELPLKSHQIQLLIKKDSDGYMVETILKENKEETDLPTRTFVNLPATIKTNVGTLTITENEMLTQEQRELYHGNYTLQVTISPSITVANKFISFLTMEPPSKKVTNMVSISLEDENVLRGIDFISHLVKSYNRRANDEKNDEAQKTDEFVHERLAKIDAELGISDAAWENTKTNYNISVPEVDAEEAMTKKGLYEIQLVELNTKLQLHDYLSEYINDKSNLYEYIPIGMGIGGSSSTSTKSSGSAEKTSGTSMSTTSSSSNLSLFAQHNQLISQRNELLKSMSERSPQILRINQTIEELHPTIVLGMSRERQNMILTRKNIEREYNKYQGRISSVPKMERVLTDVARQREIKQAVYLLMLQKREETAMDLANTTDKGKLIDDVLPDPDSANPKKKVVLLAAIFLGVLIPLVVLLLMQLFKKVIDSRQDIESLISKPIVGEIPFGNNDEAIRTLRTNLLQSLTPEQRVILISSNNDADGKTYIAKQLTESLSAIGKKTQYMDLDLRSSSLRSQSLSKGHPADILASNDFAVQMQQAKADNDYIILDSPSIALYNDAYQIAQYADVTCYVVKPGITPKAVLTHIEKDTRLPNMGIIINAIDMSKKKYQVFYKS